jgi:hypothetical protein
MTKECCRLKPQGDEEGDNQRHFYMSSSIVQTGDWKNMTWHTEKFLSTLSTHESRMFWSVHFLGSFKGRDLISNM